MPEIQHRTLLMKSIATALLVALALTSASTWLHRGVLRRALEPLDQQAESQIDATMTRAVYTFAAARGINALVSTLQATSLAVSPAGVGVTVGVGEILDPINDLIERFSWIMLISTTALGLQRLLLEMGDWVAIQGLLTMALLFLAVSLWKRALGRIDFRRWAGQFLLLALLVRFFIPAYCLASEAIYDRFLASRYEKATLSLDTLHQDLKTTATMAGRENDSDPSRGYLKDMRQMLQDTRAFMDIRQRIEHLKTKLAHITEYTVSLIVVFILQTILLPLAMLWLFAWVVRHPSRLALSSSKTDVHPLRPDGSMNSPSEEETRKPPEINS